MSAYKFTEDELESLTKAINERLDSIPLRSNQRLGFPPMAKGKDVTNRYLTVNANVEHFKQKGMN